MNEPVMTTSNNPPSSGHRHAAVDTTTTEPPLHPPFPPTRSGRVLYAAALVFSVFQIVTAAHIVDLPSQVVRAVHVGCMLALALALHTSPRPRGRLAMGWIGAALALAIAAYQWVEFDALLVRAGDPTALDLAVGVSLLALLFVAARRVLGLALPVIAGVFLLYSLFGQYLPAPLNHRGYALSQVIDHMAFGTEGIYGVPVYVSSTYIFLFILFGSFLERAGMIALFTDVALGLFGHWRGGPAKVAVASSALMGTISGSGVANVVTTGQFTIPLMIRYGYGRAFAGGVEATASMGGQIMPPVMGAVAFIMAETIDVPYAAVVQAAIIPALLYFLSAFWTVHLEAGRAGLRGLDAHQLPSPLRALRQRWYLLAPLGVLVWLLFAGFTPLFAGTVGLALTAMLVLGGAVARGIGSRGIRVLFWIALGAVAAAFSRVGMAALVTGIVALTAICLLSRGGRETLLLCRDSLADGARTALPVGVACAIVGIVIGTMTLTGAANTFGQYVVSVGQHSLFLSLVLTMLTCLVLGMGIPTIPNYIITSAIAGPALTQLGVPLLVSHMFVFYFGILADLTPPVALACFAASPIAREKGLAISLKAIKVAAAGFVIPFVAVYSPTLMLQPEGPHVATWGWGVAVVYVVVKAALAIMLWGAATVGYLLRPVGIAMRLACAASAVLLITALPLTDEAGFAMAAVVLVASWRSARWSGPKQSPSSTLTRAGTS